MSSESDQYLILLITMKNVCVLLRRFSEEAWHLPTYSRKASFDKNKGKKAMHLKAVAVIHSAVLLFLHCDCSCSVCLHPQPFVFVTLLT